tara:strand:- start:16877 stop:17470 length:594 start_codon:yes stop_codon:yes gene_type:complete
MTAVSVCLSDILGRIDATNADDVRMEMDSEGRETPKELLYGRRMSEWLAKLAPDASEPLQIACRGQHIARWRWPRSEYPEGRAGYKSWRRDLYTRHAETVVALLVELGADAATQERVALLIGKKNRTTDAESQTLEDVACMVFLDYEFAAFAAKHERAKLIRIVQKTWQKMSEDAHAAALQLELSEDLGQLVKDALA